MTDANLIEMSHVQTGRSRLQVHFISISFAKNLRPEVGAFLDRFLLQEENADTDIRVSPDDPDLTPWITWGVPDLN